MVMNHSLLTNEESGHCKCSKVFGWSQMVNVTTTPHLNSRVCWKGVSVCVLGVFFFFFFDPVIL